MCNFWASSGLLDFALPQLHVKKQRSSELAQKPGPLLGRKIAMLSFARKKFCRERALANEKISGSANFAAERSGQRQHYF